MDVDKPQENPDNHKICRTLRIAGLLLQKTITIRKRHWFGSLLEILLPVLIIFFTLIIRTSYDVEPVHVQNNTYYPILTKAELVANHVPRSILQLYYTPRNNFTNEIMKAVMQCTKLPSKQLNGFDTEDEMVQYFEIAQGRDELISVLAINFADTNGITSPEKFKYTILSSYPIPDKLFDFNCFDVASDNLIDSIPVVSIQTCLDDSFIDKVTPDGAKKPTVVIQKMPYPPYDEINSSERLIQFAVSVFGGVIFLGTIYLIPAYVSAEKTSGVNTLLKMNGVKPWQNYLSWLIIGMLFHVIPIVLITLMLKLDFGYGQKSFYNHSNGFIIWLALFINVTHVYAFCLHIASYFYKSWLAQLVAVTIPVLINVIAMQLENTNHFYLVPHLGFFFPTVSTTRIFNELNNRENELTGARWNNVFETSHAMLNYRGSIGYIMVSNILGMIFHFIIALYLDVVLPNKYGVQKRPLFFLDCLMKPNKVCCDYHIAEEKPKLLEHVDDSALTIGVRLKNLAKCFRYGYFSKPSVVEAVRNVSIDFYKGQITALLGHNGAGKTTTFSMLTGITTPSSGTVQINGKDITNNLDEIQSDLGLCPQENTVFPDLTVLEQLRLVGLLKQKDGEKRKDVLRNVDDMLEKLKLTEKRNVLPDKLSGGQKRRVCLGMALIGNSSTIFLDEPTSGMDPETSRGVWDLILQYRKQKTIVITTHSMEEADVLGDRIAIMHSGKMKCYGSSMFLKKSYGHNYHEVTLSTTSTCNEVRIQNMIGADAQMNVTHKGRIVINIPFSSSLPEILDKMENQKTELGITGVSVSLITLEQVFLRAAEEEAISEPADDVIKEPVAGNHQLLKGFDLTRQQIYALLIKKLTYFKTNKNLFIAMIIGAMLAVILPGLCFPNNGDKNHSQLLHLGLYLNSDALISSKNPILGETYKKIIEEQGGKGSLMKSDDSVTSELLSVAETDLAYYKSRIIISAEFNSSLSANGFYSGGATLSAPITLNAMSNLVLKTVAGNQYSIDASIGDLPRSLSQFSGEKATKSFRLITEVILFITVFSHVVALFVKHPHLENRTKFKQIQQMTGVSSFLYWGTMFVADYAFYILITLSTIFVIFVMDIIRQTNYIDVTQICVVSLLLLLFGINAILFAYIHSFIKKRFHIVYSILSGVPLMLTFLIVTLTKLVPWVEEFERKSIILRRIFSLEPHVSFVLGYLKFSEIAADNARCRLMPDHLDNVACTVGDLCCEMKCSNGHCLNPLSYFGEFREEGGLEEFVSYLLFSAVILVAVLCLLEQRVFVGWISRYRTKKLKSEYQSGKIESKLDIEKGIGCQVNRYDTEPYHNDENVFIAHKLRKSYGKLKAVEEMSFEVKKKECFGLLGVNGAGKSTTFRMLVGEEVSDGGYLSRGHYSITSDRKKYLKGIGYCPQTNALIPYFNTKDHLSLFARLRGIPNSEVDSEVALWIKKLQLNKCAKNPSHGYSGGNKRRLNIALALIGAPELVLLDEPTTGVDPAARRLVWTVLQNCQASGQSIILTSHSMEECETLCNRLVIMAKGRSLCSGASQELKKRFGAGFNIILKLNPGRSDDDFMEIKNRIESAFTCNLQDEHPGYLFYHLPDCGTTWVKLFGTMNTLKSEYACIEDFTVSTSTLEQLFMQFARSAADPPTKCETNFTVV